jgi:uncharacterized RDD family membrane protein YckC
MEKDYFADAYSPPGSDVNAGIPAGPQGAGAPLAERGTRLAAASLDGLVVGVPLLPMIALGIYYGVRTQVELVRSKGATAADYAPGIMSSEFTVLLVGGTLLGFLGAIGIIIYQWVLLSRTGQSLGKKWTGIRIEKIDGVRLSFGSAVVLRNWVPKVMGMVPYLGAVFHFVDLLYIFREDRRCLHDHFAGTQVVRHQR